MASGNQEPFTIHGVGVGPDGLRSPGGSPPGSERGQDGIDHSPAAIAARRFRAFYLSLDKPQRKRFTELTGLAQADQPEDLKVAHGLMGWGTALFIWTLVVWALGWPGVGLGTAAVLFIFGLGKSRDHG